MVMKLIKYSKSYLPQIWVIFLLIVLGFSCSRDQSLSVKYILDGHGAVIRTDTTRKVIHLVFTGHEYADGFPVIKNVLDKYRIKASFFFTGDFYRNPDFDFLIKTLVRDGHYLGAHSDQHLLYCSWEKRDSLLIDRSTFTEDLKQNYEEMKKYGIKKSEALWFMPPYEWYNMVIAQWTGAIGLKLVNFSPGTRSNADYTYPDMGNRYVSSKTITASIRHHEETNGMNGFILLIHIGTDPRRKDKYYYHLDNLISDLKDKGYRFRRIDE